MKYLGSKNRITKDIVPIIESYINDDCKFYIEPFVGGANVIDKVSFREKIGSDVNEYLISLLDYVSKGGILPTSISEEEYNFVKNNKEGYEKWYVGLVGFCATFGAKWFAGYARSNGRNMTSEAIRNLEKQRGNLENITFLHGDYSYFSDVKGALIYCDPPYRQTTGYKDAFDSDVFIEWCIKMAENNTVIVSEYGIENSNFVEIWSKEYNVNFDSKRKKKKERCEKLYLVKGVS